MVLMVVVVSEVGELLVFVLVVGFIGAGFIQVVVIIVVNCPL